MDKTALFLRCKAFWDWWLTGLEAWIPEQFTDKHNAQRQIILKCRDNQFEFEILDKKGQQLAHQSSSPADVHDQENIKNWLEKYADYARALEIQPEHVLVRELSLPLTAKNNLVEILPFEVERHSPFFSDETYHAYANVQTKPDKNLSVTLYIVPKHIVVSYLKQCEPLNYRPDSLRITSGDKQNVKILLKQPLAASPEMNRLLFWLVMLSIILSGIWLYQPAMLYERKIEALTPELTQLKQQAEFVNSLSQQNQLLLQKNRILNEYSENHLSMFVLLSKLSEVLPEGSWLEKCVIEGDQVTLQGYTGSQLALSELLNNSNILEQIMMTSNDRYAAIDGKAYFELKAMIAKVSGADV